MNIFSTIPAILMSLLGAVLVVLGAGIGDDALSLTGSVMQLFAIIWVMIVVFVL